jgi:hypothetical protein
MTVYKDSGIYQKALFAAHQFTDYQTGSVRPLIGMQIPKTKRNEWEKERKPADSRRCFIGLDFY